MEHIEKLWPSDRKGFLIRGPKLFNVLPRHLRDYNGRVGTFKYTLDKFLTKIPDQPTCPGYNQSAISNCVIDQLAQLTADGI